MARYNEILVGRYNRLLQKLFQMKGGPPAPQLSGDIQVNFNLFNGVENRYLEGWNRYAHNTEVGPGGALNVSQVRLRNPVASNVVAVIEKARAHSNVTTDVIWEYGETSTDLATTLVPRPIDARQSPTTAGAVCVLSSKNNSAYASIGTTIEDTPQLATQTLQADLIRTENQEIALLPGFAIQLYSSVANTLLNATWMWRERFLEESERT